MGKVDRSTFCALITMPLLACTQSTDKQESAHEIRAQEIMVSSKIPDRLDAQGRHVLFLTITPEGNINSPRFAGMTNLPEGTRLQLTLEAQRIHYLAQNDITVSSGRFLSNSFTNEGTPLLPGTYRVKISAPLSDIQPDSVKTSIGKDYENYVGNQFSDTYIQKIYMGRVIDTSTIFKVPGALTAEAIEAATRQAEQELRDNMMQSCAWIEKRAGRATRTDSAQAKIKACADKLYDEVKSNAHA